jgi:putative copper resistance protein D
MPGMSPVHYSLRVLLTDWEHSAFPLVVLAALIAAGYWYLRADWALARRGRRWSGKRTASFMAGLVAIDLALQSPVASLTASYFQAHVFQHLLLMVVAPPLLAMGAPMTLILQTSSRRTKSFCLRVLNSKPFVAISHPVPVWFLYYGVMFMFFLTPLLGYAMQHMALMDVINLFFLAGSTLFWWPIVGLDPIPHWSMGYGARLGNLAIGVPVEAFLGVALLNQRHGVAPMYSVTSTHAGGAYLWILAELFGVAAMIPIVAQWMRAEDRKAAREDARLDAEEAARAAALAHVAPAAAPAGAAGTAGEAE